MGLFSAITKIMVDVITLPIDIVKDVYTIGGIATEQKKPYTMQKLDQIKKDAEESDK